MLNLRSPVMIIAASLAASPVMAQTASPPAGVVATTNNPNLAVANVKLENGSRVSKIIGAAVYSDANEKIGTVDDVILTEGDKVTVAVVAIGGVLGLGAKLVALPYTQLKRDGDRMTLPGVTKDALNAMPGFIY